jgi:ABC-type sugar transport system substrate-binding protein
MAAKKEGKSSAKGFVPAAEIKAPPGASLYVLPADVKAKKQIRIATIMVQNNPFGMAVMKGTLIGLSEALQPVVDKAVGEGMLVYTFNTEPGLKSKRQAFWVQDGFWGGQKCGNLLMEAVGGQGKYAIITGSFNVLGHELRRTGARDVLDKNPKMKLIGEFENQDKAEETYNVTQNLLTSNPDIKGIYVTAGGPFGAAKAIKDAGLTGKVKLVCHDWMAETVPYIREGVVTACLDQDPFNQGYAPVVSAFNKLAAGINPPKEVNWFEGDVATPANVAEKIPL